MIKLKEGQTVISKKGDTYITESGDVLQERDNSISTLTDIGLVDKLVEFIKTNPFPTDDALHTFAKDNGYEPDEVEQYAYAMLSVILTGGKSKGYVIQAEEDALDIGDEIEKEHVELDVSNSVINRIQQHLINKIKYDHLAEDKDYYYNQLFIDELNKETRE